MDDLTAIQRLLRLKRYEAPEPAYFEDFLSEFHDRQRAELLKRPLWRLALDRLGASLPTFHVPQYAYAGSCALALIVAGGISGRILTSPAGSRLAGGSSSQHDAAAPELVAASSKIPRIDFYASKPAFRLSETDFEHPIPTTAAYTAMASPRYVLDSQPVSYGQPFSF